MNIRFLCRQIIKASAIFFGWFFSILVSAVKPEASDRPLSDGSDMFGDYNFRTGKFDAGNDPDGWYEDDM